MMLNVMNEYVLHDVEQYDCGQSRTAYTNAFPEQVFLSITKATYL